MLFSFQGFKDASRKLQRNLKYDVDLLKFVSLCCDVHSSVVGPRTFRTAQRTYWPFTWFLNVGYMLKKFPLSVWFLKLITLSNDEPRMATEALIIGSSVKKKCISKQSNVISAGSFQAINHYNTIHKRQCASRGILLCSSASAQFLIRFLVGHSSLFQTNRTILCSGWLVFFFNGWYQLWNVATKKIISEQSADIWRSGTQWSEVVRLHGITV